MGIRRPLPFLAATAGSSITRPIRLCPSLTMAQVNREISQARKPALTLSSTMTRLRSGYRPASAAGSSNRSSFFAEDLCRLAAH